MQKKGIDQHIGRRLKSYTFIRLLGSGAWADVYQVFDDKSNTTAACKVIKKQKMVETPKLKELVKTEIAVLQRCQSDNVIKYIDSATTEKNVYIFTEFCNGGDLEHYIRKKKRLSEDEGVEFLKQILNGFRGLHEVGAMHRDFKSANILLHNGVAKIADLGFSKILSGQIITNTILGTSVTMAPELLDNRPYGYECDIWSVGVVYYQILTGIYPYTAINDAEILKKIKAPNSLKFPPNIAISEQSKDFIRRCLTIDPKQRISWRAIYQHKLLTDQKQNDMRQTYIGNLKSKINIGNNKNFYKQEPKIPKDLNLYPNFQFNQGPELQNQANIDIIQKQVQIRKQIQECINVYSQKYLELRNMSMLAFKHGIARIYELQALPIDQNLYAFLICKRAFHQISSLKNYLRNRDNIFQITLYAQEFFNSNQYQRIKEQIDNDYQIVRMHTQSFMMEVLAANPNINTNIKKQLHLNSIGAMFGTVYVEELKRYTYMLFDYRDKPGVNKDTLIRLMTFVCDLINGISVSTEEYNKRISSMDTVQREKGFKITIENIHKNGAH